MKKPSQLISALAATMAITSSAAFAQSNANNKDLVVRALTDLFVKRDVTALDRYWDAGYIQHNPRMPNGAEFLRRFVAAMKPEFKYEPGLVLGKRSIDHVLAIAEGA